MSYESLIPMFAVAVMALIHGAFVVAGLLLVKFSQSWLTVGFVTLGVIVVSIALNAVGFLLQGRERAESILLPGGEMFAFVFLPTIVSTVISAVMIMFTAYGLFVAPGAQKHV